MMKKIILAIALLLAPSLAWGQCTGVFPNNTACGNVTGGGTPRPVPSTSFPVGLVIGSTVITNGTNQYLLFNNNGVLGNESFAALLAAPTASVGLFAVNGSATTAMRSDAAPPLSQAISPTMTGNWTFNPTSTVLPIFLGNQNLTSTAAHGLAFNQAGAFTTTSTFSYNTIAVQTNAVVNSPGVSARGFDVGVQVGASAKGSVVGVNAEADQLTASVTTGGDIVGVVGTAFATQPNGGTDPVSDAHGTLFGSSLIGVAANGATAYQIVTGSELQAIIQTGGTAQIRFAASIAGNGSVRGSTYDAGIGFYNYTSGGGFANAILLTNILTNPPIITSGCVICTDGSSNTIATGIDLSAYTISVNFLKGPGDLFHVTGAGVIKGIGTNLTGTAAGLTAGNVTTNANLTGDVTSVGNATTLASTISGAKIFSTSLQIGAPTGGDEGTGTINPAGAYYANGTKGVTCSGALTVISSITIKNGIITAAAGTGGTCS